VVAGGAEWRASWSRASPAASGLDLLVGVLDEFGDELAGLAPGRVVLERDLDVGGRPAVVEADRADVVEVGAPMLRQAMRWLAMSSTMT
jgi:hypothetical protein